MRIYAVSSGKHTFDERSEHDFAKELLVAQQENFNRQDVIIPGMKNFVRKGFHLGTAPRGYDKYGPRVTDPRRVQGIQEIKINKEGRWLKKAFKMKIYEDATDKEIIVHVNKFDRLATLRNARNFSAFTFLETRDSEGNKSAILKTRENRPTGLGTADIVEGLPEINDHATPVNDAENIRLGKIYRHLGAE